MYISNLVFGLALLGGSPPSAFAEAKPIGMACVTKIQSLAGCYHPDHLPYLSEHETRMMMCVNCVWDSFFNQLDKKNGMDCGELEGYYASCSDVCEAQCNNEVLDVFQCFCDEGKNSHASEGAYLAEE